MTRRIRPNTLLDPIRSLIQEHNNRVENSICVRILTVILQILTLGIYNYKKNLLIDPIGRALGGGAVVQRKICPISDQKRFEIRDKTNALMHQHLANPKTPFLSEKDKVCLYKNNRLQRNMRDTDLLSSFDVLQVPCYMDYDEKWELRSEKQEYFFAHHVAAPDLSSDYGFGRYSENGKLNEHKYLEDMRIVFRSTLRAQTLSGAEDAVWVPLGMGAFLDKLGEKDPTYKDPKAMDSLRGKLADLFFGTVLLEPDLHIHLCLIENAPENKRAFESILSSSPGSPRPEESGDGPYRRRCDASDTRLGKPEWSLQRELYECGQL